MAEVAGTLRISPNTCRTHTRSLYRKLGARTRAEALAAAGAAHLV